MDIKYGDSLAKSVNVSSEDYFVTADWLLNELKNNNNIVLLDFSYNDSLQNPKAREVKDENDPNDPFNRHYESEHIEGAVRIKVSEVEEADTFNIKSAEEVKKVFLNKGINSETLVVVYSDSIVVAAYVAFIAHWLGVKHVKLLDGGYNNWKELGYPISSEQTIPSAKENFGVEVPAKENILQKNPDDLIQAKRENPELVIASVRSWREYLNEESGYRYVETNMNKEVAGAVYAKSSVINDCNYFVDSNEHVYYSKEVLADWQSWGITEDKSISFYCGGGYRAALVYFIAKQLGWEYVSVFQGGSFQWNKYHMENPEKYPVQIGNPKDGSDKIFDE